MATRQWHGRRFDRRVVRVRWKAMWWKSLRAGTNERAIIAKTLNRIPLRERASVEELAFPLRKKMDLSRATDEFRISQQRSVLGLLIAHSMMDRPDDTSEFQPHDAEHFRHREASFEQMQLNGSISRREFTKISSTNIRASRVSLFDWLLRIFRILRLKATTKSDLNDYFSVNCFTYLRFAASYHYYYKMIHYYKVKCSYQCAKSRVAQSCFVG